MFVSSLSRNISKIDRKMTNSVDPDPSAPYEQSDQGQHCLLRHLCLNIYGQYGR